MNIAQRSALMYTYLDQSKKVNEKIMPKSEPRQHASTLS